MSLLFNTLSRFVPALLPRSKRLLILWLQSPSAVILQPKKIKSVTVSTFSPSVCHKQYEHPITILIKQVHFLSRELLGLYNRGEKNPMFLPVTLFSFCTFSWFSISRLQRKCLARGRASEAIEIRVFHFSSSKAFLLFHFSSSSQIISLPSAEDAHYPGYF